MHKCQAITLASGHARQLLVELSGVSVHYPELLWCPDNSRVCPPLCILSLARQPNSC